MSKVIWLSFTILLLIMLMNNSGGEYINSTYSKQNNIQLESQTSITFDDETLNWNLNAVHRQSGHKLTGLNEILGGGACVIDYDSDGWEDVFIIGGSGQHRFYGRTTWWSDSEGNTLWRNMGDGSFVNVSDKANLPKTEWGMGCAIGDLDNDGYMDLLILNIGKNTLLKNNGNGTFTDISDLSGISADESWSMSASMADFDGDGLLDIYVVNFVEYEKAAKVFERASGFWDTAEASFDPVLYNSQSNNLYKNIGNMRFIDKASSIGVDDTTGRGKATRWLDVNNDQLSDLVVLNSGGSPNQLYINKGSEAGFKTMPSIYRIESASGTHSVAVGDVDNDGDMDMVLSRPSGMPPMLLINNESLSEDKFYKTKVTEGYEDLAWEMGLANDKKLYQDNWGAVLADFNNDGRLDVYIANGLAMIDPDSSHVTTGQDDAIWVNKNGHFELSDYYDPYKLPSRGIVQADFNNDGLMDLLVTQNNGFIRLLINKTKSDNHWLGIILKDNDRTELGVKLTLQSTSIIQTKQFYMESSYLSQGTTRIHFGLPANDKIISLTVEWPDGTSQFFSEFKLDQYVVVNKESNTLHKMSYQSFEKNNKKSLYESINDTNKRLFIEVISLIRKNEIATEELMLAFNDKNAIVRKEALNGLFMVKSKKLLSAIHNSMSDESNIVRIYAIELLKELEYERSIPWLISALSDKNSGVKCAASNTFEKFFKEEEAVILRKYLAMPYLIQLLDDEVPMVRICAANALAESERYRGVMPLIKHIYDEDVNVRSSVIRALGFLRDNKALKHLREVILSPDQPATIKAHALIAIWKLNIDIYGEIINDLFILPKDMGDIKNGVDVIDALFEINESIVLDMKALHNIRNKLVMQTCNLDYKKYCSEFSSSLNSNHDKIIKNEFDVFVEKSRVKELINFVNNQEKSMSMRKKILKHLVHNNNKIAKSMLMKIVKDNNDLIVVHAIDNLQVFHEEKDVRNLLWTFMDNKENSQKIRLMAAKILIVNEQEKVMNALYTLDK